MRFHPRAIALSWLAPLAGPALLAQGHTLPTDLNYADAVHVLNRAAFGATPAMAAAVIGPLAVYQNWLQQQLNPAGVAENPALAPMLANLNLPPSPTSTSTVSSLQKARLAYATLSFRQVRETLTHFWEVHFNTDLLQSRIYFAAHATPTLPPAQAEDRACYLEWTDNEMFRANALGTFRTLIENVTKSPAMLIYLNGLQNVNCNGNENYARELLELYTMGETYAGPALPGHATGARNYQQEDIRLVARVLSGHTIDFTLPPPYGATFNAGQHCAQAYTTPLFNSLDPSLRLTMPNAGAQELTILLDHIAQSPLTADFICRKLVLWFIGDDAAVPGAEEGLLNDMKAVWGQQGNLQAVASVLFNSDVFLAPDYRWKRACTPFERVVRPIRMLDMQLPNGLFAKLFIPRLRVEQQSEEQFLFVSPDGFPRASNEQLGSSMSLDACIGGGDVYRQFWQFASAYPAHPSVGLIGMTSGLTNLHDPVEVATFLLDKLYPGRWTTVDRDAVRDALLRPVNTSSLAAPPNTSPFDYESQLALGISAALCLVHNSLK